MMDVPSIGPSVGVPLILVAAILSSAQPAMSFCVRNDTGAQIRIEAIDGTANFSTELDNNKKTCCQPKDQNCAIGKADVKLSITAAEGDAACAISVDPKGNINVTGKAGALRCKANKAGSTMDWASG